MNYSIQTILTAENAESAEGLCPFFLISVFSMGYFLVFKRLKLSSFKIIDIILH